VDRELATCRSDVLGVQECVLGKGVTERMCTFFMESHQLEAGFLVHQRIISTVKEVQFVSDRMYYILMRGHSFDIIF
jgi:hypothetical protein